jgi:hypothetical protein
MRLVPSAGFATKCPLPDLPAPVLLAHCGVNA